MHSRLFLWSARRDLNPRSPESESVALSSCATGGNIQFFRRIANGEYKNVKIVTKYDKDGNKIGTTVEESSDLDTRIKAQKEVMRMVGINDVVELGKVEAQNINIMIVDASKKNDEQEKLDIKGDIKEVDGKIEIVKEEKSNG